jgi:hypothetical protein
MNSGASDTKHTRKTKGRATRTPLKLGMNSGASDTKHTRKTKGRATRTPLKTGDELMCL